MQYKADTPEAYINQLPEDRKEPIEKLRQLILNNLPVEMEEVINYARLCDTTVIRKHHFDLKKQRLFHSTLSVNSLQN